MTDDWWMTLPQLAVYAHVSVRTLRRKLATLPHQRFGRRVLVRRSAFDAWLAAQPSTGVDPVARRAAALARRLTRA